MSRNYHCSRLVLLPALLLVLPAGVGSRSAAADDEANAQKPVASETIPLDRLRQPGDDELTPAAPPTDAQRRRSEAKSWYMTGLMLQEREQDTDAWEAFVRAIELDPDAVAVYRAMIPLAVRMQKYDEAIKYSQKIVELDPNDYEVLHQLARFNLGQEDIEGALLLFERALRSDQLERESAFFVMLNRDLAILYSATGQSEQAADCYEVLLDALIDPDRFGIEPSAHRRLMSRATTGFDRIGQALMAVGRTERAIEAYTGLEESLGNLAGTHNISLAEIYLQTSRPVEAEQQLRKYLGAQLQSRGRRAYMLLKEILSAAGRADELLPDVEKLAADDPRNSTLQYFLADQYIEIGRFDDAESLIRKVLEGSGDPKGYLSLTRIYQSRQNANELLDSLVQAFRGGVEFERLEPQLKQIAEDENLAPKLLERATELKDQDVPLLDAIGALIAARVAMNTEQTDQALAFFGFAIAGPMPESVALDIYQDYGAMLLVEEQYELASDVYEKASRHRAFAQRERAFLLFRLSQARELNGDSDEALDAVMAARRIFPRSPRLHYQEGWIYYHSRQWERAIQVFERVEQEFAGDAETVRQCRFSLSNIYVQRGELEKGEEVLERVYDTDPDDPSVNNDLGYLYADQGKKLEQAESMIRLAIEAEPENAAYLDSMGWVLFQLEKYDEAIDWLEKASQLPAGDDATIIEHKGDCLEKLNRLTEAREAWKAALEKARQKSRPNEAMISRLEEKLGAHELAAPK